MKTIQSLFKTPCPFGREFTQFFKIAIAITFLVSFSQLYFEQLVFDKVAIENGEYWRLLTCHFIHSSFSHGFWDVLAFSGSLVWLARYSAKTLVPAVLAGITTVSMLLLSDFSPFQYYCGLSGILFSPLVVAAYHHANHHKNIVGFAPILVISAKLVIDFVSDSTVFVNTNWYAYPESHLAGATAGLAIICSGICIGKRTHLLRGFS